MKKTIVRVAFLSALICGLVCVLPVVGQETVKSEWWNGTQGIILIEAEIDSPYTVTLYQNYTVINILSLYDKYEKECYADSTDMGWGLYLSDMGATWWTPMDSSESFWKPIHRYDHRVPTFKGFIKFLRGVGKTSH